MAGLCEENAVGGEAGAEGPGVHRPALVDGGEGLGPAWLDRKITNRLGPGGRGTADGSGSRYGLWVSHVDLVVTQSLGPPRPTGRRHRGNGGTVTTGASLHGRHIHIVISLPDGLLLVPVDHVKVPLSGPGPPPPVSGLPPALAVLPV